MSKTSAKVGKAAESRRRKEKWKIFPCVKSVITPSGAIAWTKKQRHGNVNSWLTFEWKGILGCNRIEYCR